MALRMWTLTMGSVLRQRQQLQVWREPHADGFCKSQHSPQGRFGNCEGARACLDDGQAFAKQQCEHLSAKSVTWTSKSNASHQGARVVHSAPNSHSPRSGIISVAEGQHALSCQTSVISAGEHEYAPPHLFGDPLHRILCGPSDFELRRWWAPRRYWGERGAFAARIDSKGKCAAEWSQFHAGLTAAFRTPFEYQEHGLLEVALSSGQALSRRSQRPAVRKGDGWYVVQ